MNRDQFVSLEEAFTGQPLVGEKKPKSTKKKVPPQPSSSHSPSPQQTAQTAQTAQPAQPAQPKNKTNENDEDEQQSTDPEPGSVGITEGFALPGETASLSDWTNAFTLAPSSTAFSNPLIDGQSSSWRKIPVPISSSPGSGIVPISSNSLSNIPLDIQRKLDQLTQQIEALAGTPMQNTAELFLFIAIGLLFILAIDSLLRFATMIAISTMKQMTKMKLGRMRR